MLCQLVCVDRRYQRMNCFNIREVESLLKRRFFTDLINSTDHHTLLNKTAIGLRYKLDDSALTSGNIQMIYNYGISLNTSIRTESFFSNSTKTNVDKTQIFNVNSYFYQLITYFNLSNIFYFLNNFLFLLFKNTSFLSNPLAVEFFSINSVITNTINSLFYAASTLYTLFTHILLSITHTLYFLQYFIDLFLFIFISLKEGAHFLNKQIIFFKQTDANILTNLSFNLNNFSTLSLVPSFSFLHNNYDFSSIFKNNTYAFIVSIFDSLCKILYKFIEEFSFDLHSFRFNLNFNFENNFFFTNLLNLLKIAVNN